MLRDRESPGYTDISVYYFIWHFDRVFWLVVRFVVSLFRFTIVWHTASPLIITTAHNHTMDLSARLFDRVLRLLRQFCLHKNEIHLLRITFEVAVCVLITKENKWKITYLFIESFFVCLLRSVYYEVRTTRKTSKRKKNEEKSVFGRPGIKDFMKQIETRSHTQNTPFIASQTRILFIYMRSS